MSSVWIALVKTESADTYTWPFAAEPTRHQVIEELMEYEGADPDDFKWYNETTSVHITLHEVR